MLTCNCHTASRRTPEQEANLEKSRLFIASIKPDLDKVREQIKKIRYSVIKRLKIKRYRKLYKIITNKHN